MADANTTKEKAHLAFTHDASLSQFTVPYETWLQSNSTGWNGVATGALVFDAQNRILLVRRTAHDSMPNLWEVPGGAVDAEDASILHGCARELWEETGLVARRVRRVVAPAEGAFYEFTNSTGLKRFGKFHFEVDVAAGEVRLDENEHQDYVWACEEDCLRGVVDGREILFTAPAQRDIVLEGFGGR
jgi:8-oxo-dGTP pyrophosphatase MutT (NUDIX family)